jgi:hypothetical protein
MGSTFEGLMLEKDERYEFRLLSPWLPVVPRYFERGEIQKENQQSGD